MTTILLALAILNANPATVTDADLIAAESTVYAWCDSMIADNRITDTVAATCFDDYGNRL